MSTTPSPITSLEPHWVHNYAVFIKAHEKLLIVIILAVLGFFAYSKGIDVLDRYEQRRATIDQQQINLTVAANKVLAEQLAELKIQVDGNTALAKAAIAQKHTETVKQQKTDMVLPMPDLGNRWTTVLSLQPGDIVATPDNKLSLTESAARATVVELEKIPDLIEQVVQTDAELAGCNQVRAKQDEVITGKDAEIKNINKARADDAALAKTAQKKSFLRGFKWGYIAGVGTAIAVKVFAHF